MRRMRVGLALSVLVAAVGVAASGGSAAPLGQPAQLPAHLDKPVCQHTGGDSAACQARIVTQPNGASPLASTSYQYGFSPANLASAYKWPFAPGANWVWNGQTVAIVDAYDNPNAQADLSAYRAQFGLPACTSANGCFRKVNQRGGSTPPSANVGWGQEIDLDIEMASAVCPSCKILLVEADSNSLTDLGSAVNQAATLGANAISNSYGTSGEFSSETSYEGYYNHAHIAVTVSSGDSGYGTSFPAVSRYVVAVGGTSLVSDSSTRGWSESAWSGAGSGCSSLVTKPSWQHDGGCSRRTVADVSAVADPNTGVAVYDSYGSSGGANWYVFGGTSVSSPIIASVYALAGNAGSVDYAAKLPYQSPGSLFDVTTGKNGNCVKGKKPGSSSSAAYLCTAGSGYDGPTGLGTPNGTAGF
jgi:subtilase family serine protease